MSTCSPWKGPHARAGGCLKEAVTPWEAHAGAGSCQDLQTCGERSPRWSRFAGRACDLVGTHTWSSLSLKDCTPWEGTHTGAVCEELQPMGRTHIGEVCGELSPVRGTFTLEQGQSVRSPPPEGQGAAETACDELTITPIPRPPAPLRGRRERNGSEAEPRKKGGVGGRCFKIWFYFSLS